MSKRTSLLLSTTLLCLAPCASAQNNAQDKAAYTIDPDKSSLEINVYREGFLKAFGHDHLVSAKRFSGSVQFDPNHLEASTVTFVVPTASLLVVDPGESEKDRKEVQTTMLGEKVLDAQRCPEIKFVSTAVRAIRKEGNAIHLTLDGTLSLHGVEKPISVPLQLQVETGTLHVIGEAELLQTAFGITPVKVGGGSVRVKDKLRLRFSILASSSAP